MEFLNFYDRICRVLIQYTPFNNANMYTISNSPDNGEIGIKKDGCVIVVIGLYGNLNKFISPNELSDKRNKYPNIILFAHSNGNTFSVYDYQTKQNMTCGFDAMMSVLIELVKNLNVTNVQPQSISLITSLNSLSLLTGIEHFDYDGKDILLFDDHRTTLGILFEAHKLGLFGGQIPNIVTFDFHEDCCPVNKFSVLMEKIGVNNLMEATSRQFWPFVEFDLSKLDDDWIAVAQELNLAKDVIIVGNEANHNVDNNEIIMDENGHQHRRYSIPHFSFSLGNRGCIGDSMIKEPYYTAVRNCLQYKNGRFDSGPVYPYLLDIDLDCFTGDFRDKIIAWPEQMFFNEFFSKPENAVFVRSLIRRASFITISREPSCCGSIGECNKILEYLDRYWFDGSLKTISMS